jgi:predicted nucleotidyltransferase
MVDAKVLETVNYFRDLVRKNGIHINNLILFGSSSTGTASPGSDIDIAIISDDFIDRDIFDRAHMTKDAELDTIKKFRVPLDIITLTTEEFEDPGSPISSTIRKGIMLQPASSA